ncbi:MAG: 3-methyl-2-oxobutanoate hydroxymethyltransferase [Candidatus Dichloromethanomonas elyunquensis]|nr:MAG: 3-methyl-2-oxobutanoate hydroxymethyltransferase [Candidatus Dichloromethanomonas elyunquensis]
MKKTIPELKKMAEKGEKITMLTAYDFPSASILERAGIDTILVGDSLGMVVLGYDSTVPVTMEEMLHHTKAARRGAPNTFIVADLPYLSYATPHDALNNAGRLVKEGGADAVKLEGGTDYAEIIYFLTTSGIPVVGHIGLTPQTAVQLGGFKVQGKDMESASRLLQDARAVQKAGAIMIILEAIPAALSRMITQEVNIPTIGIGAGSQCSGQVLVYHDLLGLFQRFVPKFVKQYEQLGPKTEDAVRKYCEEVKGSVFPSAEHTFQLNEEVITKLSGGK